MFNLGYKEVVLNDVTYTTFDADALDIKGFAKLLAEGVSIFHAVRAQEKASQKVTYAVNIVPSLGEVFNVVIPLEAYGRSRSDFARDFINDGEKITFQSTAVEGTAPADVAKAIVDGYNLAMAHFNDAAKLIDISLATGGFTVETTEEGQGLFLVTDDSMPRKRVKVQSANRMDGAVNYPAATEDVAFNPGVGQGQWVEESRRFADWLNIRPYGENIQGNSLGIDVYGSYTTFYIEASKDSNPAEWESHEFLKHAYVSAKMDSKPRRYVIYINEKVSADLDADMQAFVASLPGTADIEFTLADGTPGAGDGTDFFV
jgi:hypothetical protein